MNNWILKRTGRLDYDMAYGFVVVAEVESAARALAARYDMFGDDLDDVWLNSAKSSCVEIKGDHEHIVLCDFNAG